MSSKKLPCQNHLHGFEINYSNDSRLAEVLFELEVLQSFKCEAKPGEKPTAFTQAIAWAKAERAKIVQQEKSSSQAKRAARKQNRDKATK